MYVIASFDCSDRLDTVVAHVENAGIPNEQILVLPLDNNQEQSGDNFSYPDVQHPSVYHDLLAYPAILGTIMMLLGAIYGFVLKWGPILWAIIGLITGIVLGAWIDVVMNRKKTAVQSGRKALTDVIVMVKCSSDEVDTVRLIMRQQLAIGWTTYESERDSE